MNTSSAYPNPPVAPVENHGAAVEMTPNVVAHVVPPNRLAREAAELWALAGGETASARALNRRIRFRFHARPGCPPRFICRGLPHRPTANFLRALTCYSENIP